MAAPRKNIQVHTCTCGRAIFISRSQWEHIHLNTYASRTCTCGLVWEFLVEMTYHNRTDRVTDGIVNHVLYRIKVFPKTSRG